LSASRARPHRRGRARARAGTRVLRLDRTDQRCTVRPPRRPALQSPLESTHDMSHKGGILPRLAQVS
jgi:hypothetical protein